MTPQEFVDKLNWEGGIEAGLFDYGLDPNDMDNSDMELKNAVSEFLQAAKAPYDRLCELMARYEE